MYVSWKNVVKLSDAEIGSAQNTVVVKKQGQVTNSNLEETSYYYSTISIQCDQIGAPSVCGGPNSFNSVTP